ncbi:MAG TPA: hypothetical protein VFK06_25130 [Candidatus Angelobacter sp.]|nr:hypothetical protein [Candidatus Angelobacter sp.]
MDADILSKIKKVLEQEKYSEKDIVYFLVESYKFLERKYDKQFGTGKYDRIKLYRNWTCHAQLHGDSHKVFTDFVALIRAEKSKLNALGHYDWTDSMEKKIRECFRGYGPLALKNEALEFLAEIQYAGKFNWESFRINLYETIRDIPLIIKDREETIFTFECVAPRTKQNYDDLNLKAVIIGDTEYSLVLDDRSL